MSRQLTGKGAEFRLCGRPYVPVHINGKGPFWLLFDTGCTGCRITPQVANQLGLVVAEDDTTCLPEISIGSARWENVRFGVYDESPTAELLKQDFDGFLGNGFLYYVREQYSLVMNYPKRTISFRLRTQLKAAYQSEETPGWRPAPVAITLENYYTIVPVHIQGQGPYRFLLDTGASYSIVSREIAQAFDLPKGEPHSARGPSGAIDAYGSCVATLSVGDAGLSNLPVSVMDCTQVSGYVYDWVDGYLGTNFLEHFEITLDYCSQNITLYEGS